ncbi:hypothetical protein B0H19DRAFT_1025854, partial [Mycena capillaripes]
MNCTSIAYSHHRWFAHYTTDCAIPIRNVLETFRQALQPASLLALCADSQAMTLRFMRMIDFLDTLETSRYNGLTAVMEIWNLLLSTIFDPRPEVIRVLHAWGTELHINDPRYPRMRDHEILNIQSSLGAVIQMLSSKAAAAQNLQRFLLRNATISVLYYTAEFALCLLSCRTVELKFHLRDSPGRA